MPRSSSANHQILRTLRAWQEYQHRRCQEYFYDNGMLTLFSSLPVPQVQLEQIQDSCNKSTAIYSLAPHLERSINRRAFNFERSTRDDIIFELYEQWFHDHSVDIDFGTFVAKLIRIETSNDARPQTIDDIITAHKAWCDHVDINLPLCSRKNSIGGDIQDPILAHGPIGINKRQHMYYKLRPLFRALILVIDHHATPGLENEKLVHLIRANIPSKLSAPINLDRISPRLESDMFSNHPGDNVVVTTLSAAIDFVMALERREREAFPDDQRDPSIMDERGADSGCYTIAAKSLGYTGPDIRETSSNWFRRSDDEIVLRPLTPLVVCIMTRPGTGDKPIFAQYREKERAKILYGLP